MRKWQIWILLVLLPLRLWAGTVMPLPLPTQDSTSALATSATPAAEYPGHRPAATPGQTSQHEHSQPSSHALDTPQAHHDEGSMGAGSCHEGPSCMACSVCHMTAVMPGIVPNWSVVALQSVPEAPLGAWLGRAWPPLIKPPIS